MLPRNRSISSVVVVLFPDPLQRHVLFQRSAMPASMDAWLRAEHARRVQLAHQILQESLDLTGSRKRATQESKAGKTQASGTVGRARVSHPHKGVRDEPYRRYWPGTSPTLGEQINSSRFSRPPRLRKSGIIHGDDRQIRFLPKTAYPCPSAKIPRP